MLTFSNFQLNKDKHVQFNFFLIKLQPEKIIFNFVNPFLLSYKIGVVKFFGGFINYCIHMRTRA